MLKASFFLPAFFSIGKVLFGAVGIAREKNQVWKVSRTQIRISFKIEGITFMAEAVRAHEIIWWGGTVKSNGSMRTLVPKRQLEGRPWE